jgi:hypothetical protein
MCAWIRGSRRPYLAAFYPFKLLGESEPIGRNFLECVLHAWVCCFRPALPCRDPKPPVLFWAGMHDAASFIHDLPASISGPGAYGQAVIGSATLIESFAGNRARIDC